MHGLRYLVDAGNPLVRVAWLSTILTCISSAAAIIYINVLNWSNSPAVVTSVYPELAEVRSNTSKTRNDAVI